MTKHYKDIKEEFKKEGYCLLDQNYTTSKSPMKTKCPNGHEYITTWNRFQHGYRCGKCAGVAKKNIEEIRQYIERHGYELISNEYKSSQSKMIFKCPNGHEYKSSWGKFKSGRRCTECSPTKKRTHEDIENYIQSCGYKLNGKYENNRKALYMICPKGHEFKMNWKSFHNSEQRCPVCAGSQPKTIDEISQYISEFGCELLSSEYINIHSRLTIKCSKGHVYEAQWNVFQQGHRCPRCSKHISNEELEVYDFVKSLAPSALTRQRPEWMEGKELDIYIPELNLAIEYCGLFWHTTQWKKKPNYHRKKFMLCREHGVTLITIFSDEWLNKKELIKKMIEYRLGKLKATKIRASECEIRPIPLLEEKKFFDSFHAAGHARSSISYGLYHGDILITGLTFRKPYAIKEKDTVEICRLANNYNYMVYGGFSKLLKTAVTDLSKSFNKLITYSDCRFGQGEVYRNNGFTFIRHSSPNYWYTKGETREFRFKYRRQDKFNHLGKTEREQTEAQDLYAIYDCGHYKWELNLNPLALPPT